MVSDGWDRERIIEQSKEVLDEFAGTPITVRQLYYQLVTRGLPNGQKYYKRVVAAMEKARWAYEVDFDAFVDRDRDVVGETSADPTNLADKVQHGKWAIDHYLKSYRKNPWENQEKYVEVWIEKKALQGVFESPCRRMDVGLFPCKGYPSLTALYEAHERFDDAIDRDQEIVILYFGDHDPSGDDIPRSLEVNLGRMGTRITLIRCALTKEQVLEHGLPPAPTKSTDSRSASWDGLGQVELDALNPRTLQRMTKGAIEEHFDQEAYAELKKIEAEERGEYQEQLQDHMQELFGSDDDDDDYSDEEE